MAIKRVVRRGSHDGAFKERCLDRGCEEFTGRSKFGIHDGLQSGSDTLQLSLKPWVDLKDDLDSAHEPSEGQLGYIMVLPWVFSVNTTPTPVHTTPSQVWVITHRFASITMV